MTRAELNTLLFKFAASQHDYWTEGEKHYRQTADKYREQLLDQLITWRDLAADPPEDNEAIVVKAVVSGEEMLVNENYRPLDSAYPAGAEWMSLEGK